MNAFRIALLLLLSLTTYQNHVTAAESALYKVVNQYTKDNGLPVNAVTDLVIDKTGFLWVATHDGLLRFDGLNFKLFNTSNHPSMPSNRIRMLKTIESGEILILFNLNDLYIFNGSSFSKVGEVETNSFALKDNKLWFGTQQGLFVRDLDSHQTHQIIHNAKVSSVALSKDGIYYADDHCAIHFYNHQQQSTSQLTQLNCRRLNEMKLSDNKKLAVGTDIGVFVISDDIDQYLLDQEVVKLSWVEDRLFTLSSSVHVIEPDGQIELIAHPNQWIIYLDPPAQKSSHENVWVNAFTTLLKDDKIAFRSPSPIFKHIFDDRGGLWVATMGDGLFYLRKPIIDTVGLEENQLSTGYITSVARMTDGYYLTSERIGLYRFNPTVNTWHKYDSIEYLDTFLYDSSDRIWVAHRGVCIIDHHEKCQKQPFPVSPYADIQLLFEDSSGQIWVGSDEGLFVYTHGQGHLISDLDEKYVFAQDVPGKGVFLASRQHGISLFSDNQKVEKIDTIRGLPSNKIRSLYYDPLFLKDALLVGTEDKGLCLWHFENGLMRCASTAEGLPHYGIHHILPDQNNRLWFSSNNGIFAINIDNLRQFFNHNIDYLPNHQLGKSDGMADSEANGGFQATGTIGYHGNLWFPTQKGLVRVPANDINFNEPPLTVYFDEIKVAGVSQDNHRNIKIDNPKSRKLTLSLSTIALGLSDGVQFRYRLKAKEPWNILNAKEISFDALAPGQHNIEFQVARYGNWIGPIKSLNVSVTPRLMELIWFRILLIACIVLTLLWWIYRLRKRKELLEVEVGKRTTQLSSALDTIFKQKEKIKQTAARKQQHFLELSHELRTPLTLILGPLHSDTAINAETQKMMARNADNLLNLINQMLKLEQLDVFKEKSTLTTIDMVSKCHLGLDQFKQETDKRSLTIEIKSPDHDVNIQGVSEEIDTLLINLMSNAIKFTPVGGTIRIVVEETENQKCLILFEDSGPGIPQKDRKQVFERFVRLNHKNVEGSGLGLAIVKRIIQHHQGTIQIMDSDLGGVKFTISFPLSNQSSALKEQENRHSPSSKRSILVIDDNSDILDYCESILSKHYQVTTTQFPEEGLKLATRMVPDLIIVDINMPEIDGFELMTRLRDHVDTKNIPVIFATARAHPDDQVKAMNKGGDAFIAKPFTTEQLLAYVNRLLTPKNNALATLPTKVIKQNTLLGRAKSVIHQALADSDFGVEQLAAELAMSRSALYRKFKEEVDISPAEYINRCRMEHADELLRNTLLSVAKIAELTGFKQVSTFNRSFNRFYGHNPTEHRKR